VAFKIRQNPFPAEAIQYNTIQYNTIQYNTIKYNTIQYKTYNAPYVTKMLFVGAGMTRD